MSATLLDDVSSAGIGAHHDKDKTVNHIFSHLYGSYELSLAQQLAMLEGIRSRVLAHDLAALSAPVDRAIVAVEAALALDTAALVPVDRTHASDAAKQLGTLARSVYNTLKSAADLDFQPGAAATLQALFPKGLGAVTRGDHVARAGRYSHLAAMMRDPVHRAVLHDLALTPAVERFLPLVTGFNTAIFQVGASHGSAQVAARDLATAATRRVLFLAAGLHDPSEPASMARLASVLEPFEVLRGRLQEHYRERAAQQNRGEEVEEDVCEVEHGGAVLPWPGDAGGVVGGMSQVG